MSGVGDLDEADIAAAMPRVRAYVGRRVADKAACDDIVAATLERAYRYRHSFDGKRELGGWLTGIARTQIAEHFKPRPYDLVPELPASIADPHSGDDFDRVHELDLFESMIRYLRERGTSDVGLRVAGTIFFADTISEAARMAGISRQRFYSEWRPVRQMLDESSEEMRLLVHGSDTFSHSGGRGVDNRNPSGASERGRASSLTK